MIFSLFADIHFNGHVKDGEKHFLISTTLCSHMIQNVQRTAELRLSWATCAGTERLNREFGFETLDLKIRNICRHQESTKLLFSELGSRHLLMRDCSWLFDLPLQTARGLATLVGMFSILELPHSPASSILLLMLSKPFQWLHYYFPTKISNDRFSTLCTSYSCSSVAKQMMACWSQWCLEYNRET